MTFQQFLDKYLGQSKGYPTDSQYKGECLSIVKLFIKEMYGIDPPPSGTNSAYGYWSNFPSPLGTKFEKVVNSDTLVPEEGWIAIWEPWSTNEFGHIALVAKGCTTGTLKNYAQNWTSKVFQLESNRYTNVVGFLKPKQLPVDETMTEEQKRILDFIGTRTEGDVRSAFGALADVSNLTKEIEGLKTSQVNLEIRITDLEQELASTKKSEADWQQQLKTANKTNQSLTADIAYYKPYKALYEKALTDQVNKYTGIQLIQMGLKKLLIKK